MAVAPTEPPGASARAWLRARYVPSVGGETRARQAATAAIPAKLLSSRSSRVANGNLVPNFVPDSANMTPVKLVQLGHIWPY